MSDAALVLKVAVLAPLRGVFDYLPPDDALPSVGARVRVPFGRSTRVGVVFEHATKSALDPAELRRCHAALDEAPLLSPEIIELARFAGDYYQAGPGRILSACLPPPLRRGRPLPEAGLRHWRLTAAGRDVQPSSLRQAPRQREVLSALHHAADALPATDPALCTEAGRNALRVLEGKGWVERLHRPAMPERHQSQPGPAPNAGQAEALEAIRAGLVQAGVWLLEGITGSGKTEIYLHLADEVLKQDRQVLVIVPEIALTPQLVQRFQERLGRPVAVLHSDLPDGERTAAWRDLARGDAEVGIATRLGVFVPLARPGLIVVDEEHDPALKQEEGVRYHARDLAVYRGQVAAVPVILGSATPSLETWHNAASGRYRQVRLPHRASGITPPVIEVLDVRQRRLLDGISEPLAEAMEEALNRDEQVLVFRNRRGFAPTLICRACGWVADCPRCDAHLVWHRRGGKLQCHHCGLERQPPPACPECGAGELKPLGTGTERLEEALAERFPHAEVLRVDRDSTSRRGSLEALLERIRTGRRQILVGTQMLAKGHDFPNLTLVGVVNADGGLFSTDFRGPERMAQLVVQVAGRAGRADKPGRIMIQSHQPDHPLLRTLVTGGYPAFAKAALAERKLAHWPPFSHLALLRAESTQAEAARQFLSQAVANAPRDRHVELWGPVDAPMRRRAGRYRVQVLINCPQRSRLQGFLRSWLETIDGLAGAKRLKWTLDVDPQNLD